MTVSKSFPPFDESAPGTFSQITKRGYLPFVATSISMMILIASQNSPDLPPPRPARFPAMLKSWQGDPNVIISTGSILSPRTSFTLPRCFICGRCVLVTAIGYGSTSLAHTARPPHITAHSGIVPLPSNRLPNFTSSAGLPSSRKAFLTKNSAFGNAIPLPHMAYSAAMLCRPSCQRINALSLSVLPPCIIFLLGLFLLISQSLAYTSRQNGNSCGEVSGAISAHPSGKPCNRPHSNGIRRRTIQSGEPFSPA